VNPGLDWFKTLGTGTGTGRAPSSECSPIHSRALAGRGTGARSEQIIYFCALLCEIPYVPDSLPFPSLFLFSCRMSDDGSRLSQTAQHPRLFCIRPPAAALSFFDTLQYTHHPASKRPLLASTNLTDSTNLTGLLSSTRLDATTLGYPRLDFRGKMAALGVESVRF
jgi:hypothetical protein